MKKTAKSRRGDRARRNGVTVFLQWWQIAGVLYIWRLSDRVDSTADVGQRVLRIEKLLVARGIMDPYARSTRQETRLIPAMGSAEQLEIPILFESASAGLLPESMRDLKTVAQTAGNSQTSTVEIEAAVVDGDAQPSVNKLTIERARRVQTVLEQFGVDRQRMSVTPVTAGNADAGSYSGVRVSVHETRLLDHDARAR